MREARTEGSEGQRTEEEDRRTKRKDKRTERKDRVTGRKDRRAERKDRRTKKKDKKEPAWRKGLAESQIAEFEGLAKSFAEGRLVKNVLKETKKRVAAAEYYVKVMERTLDRGSTYPRTERDRLKKMLKAKPANATSWAGASTRGSA